MSLTDEERKELEGALEKLPDAALLSVEFASRKLLRNLEDLNSAYPATQEFLKSRGLTNIRELDAQGKQDLTAYLKGVLAKIAN